MENCTHSDYDHFGCRVFHITEFSLPNFSPVGAILLVTVTFLYHFKGLERNGIKLFKSLGNCFSVKNETSGKIRGVEAIPGPKPLPIKLLGNVFQFYPMQETLNIVTKWSLEYGPLFKFTGANEDCVVLNSASTIQTLLKSSSDSHLVKTPVIYDLMKPLITNGVLVSTGKLWHHERKILLRSMSYHSLKIHVTMLNKHSERLVKAMTELFSDGKVHQINEQLNMSFLEVMCEMIMGFDIHQTAEGREYHHNFEYWKRCIAYRAIRPWLIPNFIWKLTPLARRNDQAIEDLINFARRRIAEHRQKRRGENGIETVGKGKDENPSSSDNDNNNCDSCVGAPLFRSVLDELLDAGVSEDQIVDEVNTMLFGGHETGASAIHFFCFMMAVHPDIQTLCRKEADEAFEDPMQFSDGKLTYDCVSGNLKLLERCILETLRLYPPVFAFLRQLQSPLKFDLTDSATTVEIGKGTTVIVVPFAIHRKPEYFPNPEQFNPDRFLSEEISQRPAHSFIPFSGGTRCCLGIKFAMMEMKMVAAYLLHNFIVTTTDKKEDIKLLPNVTLSPERDYNFCFQKR